MSYAAFVFNAKKYGFKFEKHDNNSLTFNYEHGKYYPCQLIQGKAGVECGYIIVNDEDFKILFGTNEEYLKNLYDCKKYKQNGRVNHCKLPESLWGRIETEIRLGDIINCQRNPV